MSDDKKRSEMLFPEDEIEDHISIIDVILLRDSVVLRRRWSSYED